jgi:hypothetical protein
MRRAWLLRRTRSAMNRAFGKALLLGELVLAAQTARAQQLGYKLLGSAGIDAGTLSPPGVYLIDQTLRYGANRLRGRDGNIVPIDGLDIDALGTALGVAYTLRTSHAQYFSFAIAAPVAKVDISTDNPAASLTGYGFGDLFVQPLKLGWREGRFDVVSGYNIYVPTGKFEPRGGGVGRGYWTHQFSLGGALYFDSTRASRMSALASYDRNTRSRNIQLHRGNMFQIQGGAGVGVAKVVTVGVASYALWQMTRDRGADIPPALRGQWSRVFGVGPELDVLIPKLGARVDARLEREFRVRSRPEGHVLSVGLIYQTSRSKTATRPSGT